MNTVFEFISLVILYTLPLSIAAIGGLFTFTAGSLSIGLEGFILAGAFAAAFAGHSIVTPLVALPVGIICAVAIGSLAGLVLAFFSNPLRADVYISGLAINLLVPGLASMISGWLWSTKGVVSAPGFAIGGNSGEGIAGFAILARYGWLVCLSIVVLIALWILYSKTIFGLRIKVSGQGEEVAMAASISAKKYRTLAHVIAGGCGGFAGAFIAIQIAAFVPGMSAGKGWLALVALYLYSSKPIGVIISCLIFGFAISLSNILQGINFAHISANADLLRTIPYLVTIIVLAFWKKAGKSRESF